MNNQTSEMFQVGLYFLVATGGGTLSGLEADMPFPAAQLPDRASSAVSTAVQEGASNQPQFSYSLLSHSDLTEETEEQIPADGIATVAPDLETLFTHEIQFRMGELEELKPSFDLEGPETLPDA